VESPSRPGLPLTALCDLAGIALLLRLAHAFGPAWLPAGTLAVALFLYVPLFRYRGTPWPAWMTEAGDPRRALPTLAVLGLIGVVVYLRWLWLPLPAFLKPGTPPPIAHPLSFALHQAAVALSEEVFFRGYLHDAFERHGRRPLLWTSILFAAVHLAIAPSAWRALTFFPALLFGWSRERTGTIWVPAALHFGFNLLPALYGG
jgi:membrane protease YdiL (CAAX protease family)